PTVTENTRLLASNGAEGDYFGISVSISGDDGLVGAYEHNGHGAAYYYRALSAAGETTVENTRLLASDAATGQEFGLAVSLSGQTAVVGAGGDARLGDYTGAAYLYRNLDSAGLVALESVKLFASDGAEGDEFGGAVSI